MKKMIFKDLPVEVAEYIEYLENQIERLTELVRVANQVRFGRSSEKSRYVLENPNQLSLFDEAEVCADENEPEQEPVIIEKHTRKPKRTKEELAKDLPVEEVVFDIPEAERKCSICEGELRPIGKELVRREIEIIPARIYVKETYRINYDCVDCEKETDQANIVKPTVPEPVVKRGIASPGSVAHILYQKFVNAVPLYRQEKDWANQGVQISRATMANWIIYVCLNWFAPLFLLMKSILLESPVNNADETVIQVLKEDGKKAQSQSRMWVYCTGNTGGPPIILFDYQPTRSGNCAKEFLEGFSGYLQTDGYAGYNKVEGATLCGCWEHLRRKFKEAMPSSAKKVNKATEGFKFCNKLFELEREFEKLTPEERHKERRERSKPVLEAYYSWVSSVNHLQGSKLATAITYSHNQKEALSAFLLDGRIELSNNRAENAIRPFVVGRKNWLFADSVKGAKASAMAYSIIETAKANGLNPYKYLKYLLSELPTVISSGQNEKLAKYLPWSSELPSECLARTK